MSSEQDYQPAALEAVALETNEPLCGSGEIGYCITCSDEALPARVLNVEPETGLALAEVLGTPTEIDISLVEAVVPGDWLLVHGGVAIAHAAEEDGSGFSRLGGKEQDQ